MGFDFAQKSKRSALLQIVLLVVLVALVDWRIEANVFVGILYVFPILVAGMVLNRWQMAMATLICTMLSEFFDPFPFKPIVSLSQDLLMFICLLGIGLLANEIARRRLEEMKHLQLVEQESAARCQAEEQLAFLVDNSPAAILTMNDEGIILQANSAAAHLFRVPSGKLPGEKISSHILTLGFIPSVVDSLQKFKTNMQCRGKRADGENFLADVFFSTYQTTQGPRLAAMIIDASEKIREREELSHEQLMASSRILVGAVVHEIRNVCSAMRVVYENIVRAKQLQENKDFEALGALFETLNAIASLELKHHKGETPVEAIDLAEVLNDLRIIIEPICQESEISLQWNIPEHLPMVWMEQQNLIQVFLNLLKNSERAMEETAAKRLDISASANEEFVFIRVADTGPGIKSTEGLFQPFQKSASSTGLGLYLSRALLRAYGGDLKHASAPTGCAFMIVLAVANANEKD